jgi:hypothetical protein
VLGEVMAEDYLLAGLGTLIVSTIGVFLIKLRAINLRVRILEAQIKDMHIMTSRLLLRELNSRGDPQDSSIGKPAQKEEPMSDDQSIRQPEPQGATQSVLPLSGKLR